MVLAELLESEVPRYLVMGEHAESEIVNVLKKIEIEMESPINYHIFFGPTTEKLFKSRIKNHLEIVNPRIDEYIIKEGTASEIESLYHEISNNLSPRDVLVSVGGGKIIDSIKYLVLLHQQAEGTRLEYLNLPTLTSHDGIITPYIFLHPEKNTGEKYYGEIHPPLAVIVNIDYLYECEDLPRHLAASVGDTLAKLTATWDWRFANRIKGEPFSDFASGTIFHAYDLLKAQLLLPSKSNSIQNLVATAVKALLISGVVTCTAGNMRIGFGAEHMFALALDALKPRVLLHGERCAIGTIIMAYLQDQPWKSYKKTLQQIGIIDIIKKSHISADIIEDALCRAHLAEPRLYTILGEEGISKKAAQHLIEEIGIFE